MMTSRFQCTPPRRSARLRPVICAYQDGLVLPMTRQLPGHSGVVRAAVAIFASCGQTAKQSV